MSIKMKLKQLHDSGATSGQLVLFNGSSWVASDASAISGLGAMAFENTADYYTKVSADNLFLTKAEKGVANGLATLDANGKIATSQLPAIALTDVNVVADLTARDELTVQEGDIAIVSSEGKTFIYDGSAWVELAVPTGGVQSVNGMSGVVTLTASNITGFATVATSGSYTDLADKPTLFSGAYADLTGTPDFATVAMTGDYADLINKPTLFSGSYNDLTDKPTLVSTLVGLSDVNITTGAGVDGYYVKWDNATGKFVLADVPAAGIAGIGVYEEGAEVLPAATGLNFTGDRITVTTDEGSGALVKVASVATATAAPSSTVTSGTATLSGFFTNAPISSTVLVFVNGVPADPAAISVSSTDLVVNVATLGYSLETSDVVMAKYEY